MEKILLIEDDKDIARLVEIHLADNGYSSHHCFDGLGGFDAFLNGTFDLIILDLMLPGMNGLEVCKRVRQQNMNIPILMLTAKSEELDKVLGLEIGADDYLTKPFSVRELMARVKAILRRSKSLETQKAEQEGAIIIESQGFYLDVEKRIVRIYKEDKELSPREFDLLVHLSSNKGRTYSRQQLLAEIWGYEFDGFEHTVNSHINRLRNKIEKDPQSPEFILTTWGVGYRFKDN